MGVFNMKKVDRDDIIPEKIRHDLYCCPACHATDVKMDPIVVGGGIALQRCMCMFCYAKWEDIYTYRGHKRLNGKNKGDYFSD